MALALGLLSPTKRTTSDFTVALALGFYVGVTGISRAAGGAGARPRRWRSAASEDRNQQIGDELGVSKQRWRWRSAASEDRNSFLWKGSQRMTEWRWRSAASEDRNTSGTTGTRPSRCSCGAGAQPPARWIANADPSHTIDDETAEWRWPCGASEERNVHIYDPGAR